MPIYWVTTYFINQDKAGEYQKWLKSDRAKELAKEFEMETGFKYLATYFPILGFGDFDCEDWYVANDFTAFDKVRTSKAGDKLNAETWDFTDQTRPMKSRIMRTTEDVLIFEPPKEK